VAVGLNHDIMTSFDFTILDPEPQNLSQVEYNQMRMIIAAHTIEHY
jgi:hypothetical protein